MPHVAIKRTLFTYLCGLYVLFIIYSTLLPFRFDYGWYDLPTRLSTINWHVTLHGPQRASLTDIGGNILLFMPLGFCLYVRWRYARWRYVLIWTFLGSALLSVAIEFTQTFIAVRNPAIHDVLNNTLGGLIGALAAMLYAVTLSATATRLFYHVLARQPVLLIVLAFGLLPLLAALMPFTVSITPSEVMHNLRTSNLGLFTSHSPGALVLNATTPPGVQPFDIMDFWEGVLFWSASGYVLRLCYRLCWQRRPYGKLLLWGLPLGYFPLVESMQLGITSRVSDINDILAGYVGVLTSMLLYTMLRPLRYRTSRTVMDVLHIPLVLYVMFLLFTGLRPFDWSLSLAAAVQRLTLQQMVPLHAYFQNTSLWNMYDLAAAIASFVPVSLYRASRRRARGAGWLPLVGVTTLEALLFGGLIEGAQLFSLTRSADITDVLSYGLGGGIGVFALYYYERQVVPTLAMHKHPNLVLCGLDPGDKPIYLYTGTESAFLLKEKS